MRKLVGQNKAREIVSDYHWGWGGGVRGEGGGLERGKINFLPIEIDADS